MMNERKWRIAIDVPTLARMELLRRYPPRFPVVYGDTIEWAGAVTEEYAFDDALKQVVVVGLHTTVSTQTFTVRVGGLHRRADNNLIHLVQSTMPGVMLAHAGLINQKDVFLLEQPVSFQARLERFPCAPVAASALLART